MTARLLRRKKIQSLHKLKLKVFSVHFSHIPREVKMFPLEIQPEIPDFRFCPLLKCSPEH